VNPEYPCFVHVDDLSHVIVEETPSEIKANLLKAGRLVGSEVARLKLKLSDKSMILPINDITKSVATILTQENITLKVKATGDDVGGTNDGRGNSKSKHPQQAD